MDLSQPNKRGYHNPKMEGRMWEWEKWRGECANGMDERCEANLLIASVRPAVGRAVFIIREHAIFFLEEGYFIPIIHDFLDAVGVSLLRRRPPPHGGGVDCLSPSSIPMAFLSSFLTR